MRYARCGWEPRRGTAGYRIVFSNKQEIETSEQWWLLLCDISGLIPSILPITDQLKLRSDIGINYYYLPSEASTNRPRHGPWHGIGVAWGGEKKWWTWQNSFFQILLIDAYRKWHKNMFNVWPPMTRKCWYKEIVSSPLKKTLGVSTLWPYHDATYGGVDTGNIE